MSKRIRYSPEVKERAVRLLQEHQDEYPSQWQAICSITPKIGCTGETLRSWLHKAGRDQGLRAGPSTPERERLKRIERKNRARRRANDILRKASAFFAQEVARCTVERLRFPISVEFATLDWVDWFNNHRLLEPIGNIPPVELKQAYYQSRETQAMVACLKQMSLWKTRGGSITAQPLVDRAGADAKLPSHLADTHIFPDSLHH